MTDSQKFILDHIDGDKAILISGKEKIVASKKLLPKNSKEGDDIFLTLSDEKSFSDNKERKAKEILNEILGN